MGRLAPIKQLINQLAKMSPSVFLLCFLAMGAIVHAEEWEVGLSAEEIMSTEFEKEYSDDERSIDEIIEAAGTESGAKEDAANNQAINFDMDMQMEPMQYAMEYGNAQGFAGAGMANDWYRWPKNIIPYKIQAGHFSSSQMQIIYAGTKMWMEKTCIRFTPSGSSLARSTTSESSVDADVTPMLVTLIVLMMCHSSPMDACLRVLLLTSLVILLAFTTNNAGLTETNISKLSLTMSPLNRGITSRRAEAFPPLDSLMTTVL